MFYYLQRVGGEEDWSPIPASQLEAVTARSQPMFVTALAVNKLVEDLEPDQRDKLCYEGPFYVDFDGPEISVVADQLRAFVTKLEGLGLDLESVSFYATGSKGFHAEIPSKCFVEKPSKGGTQNLPIIYKEMAFALWVDNMDMRVYSQGRGRMWRQCNVQRPNGTFKVPLTLDEVRNIDATSYQEIVSAPREAIPRKAPELCVDMAILYAKAEQKVSERMKARGKSKADPVAKEKAGCDSIKFMMAGVGVKTGVGFHELALQLAIIANTAGLSEEQLLQECDLLIANHAGDGNRYNSPSKRRAELLRMHRYCADNPMYEFKVGAIKVLLTHPAPDLDGIPVNKADIEEVIKEAAELAQPEDGEKTPDEFADVAGGVTLSKFGVYASQEDGNKRRICAVSFQDVHLLMSMDSGQLAAYEATILVNGRPAGRQTLEMDTFLSLQMFNRFAARHGHAMQGTEAHVRGVFMRFVELAKKKGKVLYIAKREGLDVLNIPNHENPAFREPFMAWADGRGVILDPRVREHSLEISFQGFPDPRGLFKTDLADAPKLVDWIKEPGNKEQLSEMLRNMLTCQRPDVMSKMLGWYTACFYRMLFHKAYSKFPLLHVHGSAGSGKSEMNATMAHLFYYQQEPKILTPASTVFAIQQHMAGSVSVPLLIDEYKPHEMHPELHNKLKLIFRDAYNAHDVSKGGGTRESDDYRSLSHTQLVAPTVFIGEAPEEESAVAERVVLITVVKPSSTISLTWLARFQRWGRSKHLLAILGQYLAGEAINTMSISKLREEFDVLYEAARNKYMLTEADLSAGLDSNTLREKQGAKERSVYNFTVALFGLKRFRRMVDAIYGPQLFEELFGELEASIYLRMADLQTATQAEWAKVLDVFSTMSYAVDAESPFALRQGSEFITYSEGGQDVIEISLAACYLKYRAFMRASSSKPLYSGTQAFVQSMRDCPALLKSGFGDKLAMPGVFKFNIERLSEFRVGQFKG